MYDHVNTCFLVLLYKTDIRVSQTIKSIRVLSNKVAADIYVYDNTPCHQDAVSVNSLACELRQNGVGFTYTELNNKPMSYVYNKFIEEVAEKYQFVGFLDQDTQLSQDFFSEVNSVIRQYGHSVDLILPKIRYLSKIVSPSWRFYAKGWYCQPSIAGLVRKRFMLYLSAINSGMVVSVSYLKRTGFRYDARLKFYGTDDYFMECFHKNGGRPFVLDVILEHDLSLSSLNSNSLDFKTRYFQMLDGWQIIYGGRRLGTALIRGYSFLHCIVKGLIYADIDYFKASLGYLLGRRG